MSYQKNRSIRLKKKKENVDTKTIKLCLSLIVLFILSFLNVILNMLKITKSLVILYPHFINNFENPVIYCWVNTDFRNELELLTEKLKFWKNYYNEFI